MALTVLKATLGRKWLITELKQLPDKTWVFQHISNGEDYTLASVFLDYKANTGNVGIVIRVYPSAHDSTSSKHYISWNGPLQVLMEFLAANKDTYAHNALMTFVREQMNSQTFADLRTALVSIDFISLDIIMVRPIRRTRIGRKPRYIPANDPAQDQLL